MGFCRTIEILKPNEGVSGKKIAGVQTGTENRQTFDSRKSLLDMQPLVRYSTESKGIENENEAKGRSKDQEAQDRTEDRRAP